VFRRLPIIICAVVGLDLLLLGALSYCFDWRFALFESIATTVIGLAVIIYYEWRWSDVVAKRLESEPRLIDSPSLEKILLLVAGIVLLIPGVLTDVFGLVLLTPGVRRLIARNCHLDS
jgi:UPF0716 family protein affecting phage T7 exclusion